MTDVWQPRLSSTTRRLITTRHLSFALVHRLIINYTTLKTGSINCHVFCILLSGNTITYQSQWPSRAGSPFPATSSAKGRGNHREPSEVIYPLSRGSLSALRRHQLVSNGPLPLQEKSYSRLYRDQAFWGEAWQERGLRGEDGRITSGKWDTRQRQTI